MNIYGTKYNRFPLLSRSFLRSSSSQFLHLDAHKSEWKEIVECIVWTSPCSSLRRLIYMLSSHQLSVHHYYCYYSSAFLNAILTYFNLILNSIRNEYALLLNYPHRSEHFVRFLPLLSRSSAAAAIDRSNLKKRAGIYSMLCIERAEKKGEGKCSRAQ